jgi:hypothetical protein
VKSFKLRAKILVVKRIELMGVVVYEPLSMAILIKTPEGVKDIVDLLYQLRGKSIRIEIAVEE